MAINNAQFQQYLSQLVDDITSEVQALETWAGNKGDSAPTFDYTTAKSNLETAKAAFVASIVTVNAL